jgi:hypothetical protein
MSTRHFSGLFFCPSRAPSQCFSHASGASRSQHRLSSFLLTKYGPRGYNVVVCLLETVPCLKRSWRHVKNSPLLLKRQKSRDLMRAKSKLQRGGGGKKQTAKENGVLSLPVLLGLHADDCHGGQHLLTTIHTTTKYYLSSYMIYCGFIGNCGWYGYWCYGLVLVGRD